MNKLLKFKDFSFLLESIRVDNDTDKALTLFKKLFQFAGFVGDRKSKHGSHLRFALDQNNNKAKAEIEKILKKAKVNNYEIKEPKIGDFADGAKSGEYQTFVVVFTESSRVMTSNVKRDTEICIVNSVPQKGVFGGKVLSPAGLKIQLETNLTLENLYNEVCNKITIKFKDMPASENVLLSLVKDVYNWTSPNTVEPTELKPFDGSIPYSSSTDSYLESLTPTDLNAIGKDFGEILGGLFLLKCVDAKFGVKYPKGNEPLVDFFLDENIKISSKYQKGASPTLSGIVKNVDLNRLSDENQKSLREILEIAQNNTVATGYLEISKRLNLPGYEVIKKITGFEDPSTNELENYVRDLVTKPDGSFDNDVFFEKFSEFYQTIGSWPKGKKIDWEKLKANDKFYGVILGPLSQYVPRVLNSDPIYTTALKSLCSMVPVNQLYLDFELKTNTMEFHLKSFIEESSEFQFEAPNQSVYNPDNGKLGFSLL
jgi:hypothetical protein